MNAHAHTNLNLQILPGSLSRHDVVGLLIRLVPHNIEDPLAQIPLLPLQVVRRAGVIRAGLLENFPAVLITKGSGTPCTVGSCTIAVTAEIKPRRSAVPRLIHTIDVVEEAVTEIVVPSPGSFASASYKSFHGVGDVIQGLSTVKTTLLTQAPSRLQKGEVNPL